MRMTMLVIPLLLVAPASAQVVNGSFETGDIEGWSVSGDGPAMPPQVVHAGTPGPFGLASQPTDGEHSVLAAIDGAGSGQSVLSQHLAIPGSRAVLLVDYVARWNLLESPGFFGDVHFEATLWGQSGWLNAWRIAEVIGGTASLDADRVTAAIDLSKHAGEGLQLDLAWNSFQSFTGLASFELDNLRLAGRQVPALQRARLAIALAFAKEHEDRLDLDLIVAVPTGFQAEGQILVVAVGGVQREFTLDAAGKAQLGADSVKLLPVPKQPDHRRLKLAVRDADLASDLQAQGLQDIDTVPAGTTVGLPIAVELGGETTTRELVGVYKSAAGVSGKVVAKAGSEVWHTALSAKLNLEIADESTLKVTTAALVPPGFTPQGQDVRVDVGDWSKTFTLDSDGKVESTVDTDGVDSIRLVRDPHNAARQLVTLTGVKGNFWDVSDIFSMLPGSATVQIPVTVTVDGRGLRSIVTVKYKATAKSGTAHG